MKSETGMTNKGQSFPLRDQERADGRSKEYKKINHIRGAGCSNKTLPSI